MERLIVVLAILPLVSALLTQLLCARLGQRVARLSVGFTLATFLIAGVLLAATVLGDASGQVALAGGWGVLMVDPLSSLMAVVISGISLIVHVYSVRYMAEEAGYGRFFALLDLMTATLLAMVAAGDLLTLLVSWHLIGVLLYFLLGQDTRSQASHRYAFWTLITYRLGDVPLVLAAGLLYYAYGTWSLTEIFARLGSGAPVPGLGGLPLPELVAGLIALAAFARSAQFLLHTWLPYTMAGPTPVSALMHAGIVNAGGFLINRFAPVFAHTGGILPWVFVVGLITALVGSFLMLSQKDVKKALGYSTMGQMGFMIMECGIGAFSIAIYHLIAHGLFKGTLFLGAGGIINQARQNDGVPKNDLYTFVVEKRAPRVHRPWLLMAAITVVVPIAILAVAHLLVSEDYFQRQGGIVLLFFGWVTGAQLLFLAYRMGRGNLGRLLASSILSFTIVVLGYTLIGHAFELFLYPDDAFRVQLYAAANLNVIGFDVLIGSTALLIVGGWMLTYYADRNGRRAARRPGGWWRRFYAAVSNEFYMIDLVGVVNRSLLSLARRLNIWLRWV